MKQLWVVHISGGSIELGDLTPDREAVNHLSSPLGRTEQMRVAAENVQRCR